MFFLFIRKIMVSINNIKTINNITSTQSINKYYTVTNIGNLYNLILYFNKFNSISQIGNTLGFLDVICYNINNINNTIIIKQSTSVTNPNIYYNIHM